MEQFFFYGRWCHKKWVGLNFNQFCCKISCGIYNGIWHQTRIFGPPTWSFGVWSSPKNSPGENFGPKCMARPSVRNLWTYFRPKFLHPSFKKKIQLSEIVPFLTFLLCCLAKFSCLIFINHFFLEPCFFFK